MIFINFFILVPPMIMQQKDNADIVAREGDNVTLACDARGHPRPQVVWRREDKEDILVNGRKGIIKNTLIILCIMLYSLSKIDICPPLRKIILLTVSAVESSRLHLTKISRLQMGKYLCVATNGVNPSSSKMFDTKVQCKEFKKKMN